MNRDEAIQMIQGYFRSFGLDSPGLNENNLGGAEVGEYQIYFEYFPAARTLKCSALVYKFHTDPDPGVIEAFKAEEFRKAADTVAGILEYEPENKGFYLSRSYSETVPEEEFAADLQQLMRASQFYGVQVLDQVASRL